MVSWCSGTGSTWPKIWMFIFTSQLGVCETTAQYQGSSLQTPITSHNETIIGCHEACNQLQNTIHRDVITHYPVTGQDFSKRFYSLQQREQRPICVVEPKSADGVSLVVRTIRETKCPFAVTSGGHSNAPGTSNRDNGLVLDLKRLNMIQVSGDRKVVSVGPGNLSRDVDKTLQPLGLTITCGRTSSVGVGGFTLGGGISYIAGKYGWAMDNVKNFEVILPNGTMANANAKSHPDIYFALRGGGSSFGIVTRFDFQAYASNTSWGGTDVHLVENLANMEIDAQVRGEPFHWTTHSVGIVACRWLQKLLFLFGMGTDIEDLVEAFVGLVDKKQTDNDAHAYITLSWIPLIKAYVSGSAYFYGKNEKDPDVMRRLTSFPTILTTRRLDNKTSFTEEAERMIPQDQRQYWCTSTFKVDATLILKIWEIFLQETKPLRNQVPDALASSNLQLVTKNQLEIGMKNGGNAFGIRPEDGPLFLFSLTTSYKDAKDDEAIRTLSIRIMDRAVETAKKMNLYHPFVYPNYASVDQNVFAGFAPENQRRLLKIQEKYDPGRVFGNLQPVHLGTHS